MMKRLVPCSPAILGRRMFGLDTVRNSTELQKRNFPQIFSTFLCREYSNVLRIVKENSELGYQMFSSCTGISGKP